MDLLNELKKEMKDESLYGVSSKSSNHMTKTGFDCFDYLNGTYSYGPNGKNYQVGIDDGKIITVIGKSGSGKTTFAIQMAYNIIKKYKDGVMYFLDFEGASDERRIKMITGMSDEEYKNKIVLKQIGISAESFLATVMAIKKVKLENKKELMVKTDEVDEEGKPIEILTPTIVLVDSFALMMPSSVSEEDEVMGQMLATQTAKMNSQILKRIVQPCLEANIIPIFINHINEKVSTGPMPTQASNMYLAADETLPGGKAALYLTNTLIRITTANKLEEDKLFKIKGFLTKISLVKSRTAPAGSSITMVYNQREGFDNELSNLQFLKDNGVVLGAGIGMYLKGMETVKFSFANFKEKLKTNPEFKEYFEKITKENLLNIIKESSKMQVEEQQNSETQILNEEE